MIKLTAVLVVIITIRNNHFLEAFAELLVIVLERIRNHTEKWVLL